MKLSGVGPLAEASMARWFTEAFRTAHPDIVAHYRRMLESSPSEGYASCCAALRDADLRGEIGGISAPTLVIVGQHDPCQARGDRVLTSAYRRQRT